MEEGILRTSPSTKLFYGWRELTEHVLDHDRHGQEVSSRPGLNL